MSLQEQVIQILKENNFNGTALIAKGDHILVQVAHGYRDMESNIPMTTDVVFRVGSITKQFTAVAILQQVEAGTIQLSDSISKYISDVPYEHVVTIHHLLSNSSGIPNFDIHADYSDYLASSNFHERMVREVILPQPLHFTPGERFEYSSSGFIILTHILEQVTGKPYHTYLDEHIFQPLRMTHSGFHFLDTTEELFSSLYDLVENQIVLAQPFDMRIASGAGGLYSCAMDLYRWNRALMESTIVPRTQRDAMQKVHAVINETGGYGYGVLSVQHQNNEHNHQLVYHPGNGPGVFGQTMVIDNDVQITLLSNINDGKTFRPCFNAILECTLKYLDE